jgi:tRNA 2-selenouridine synthase
MLEPDRIFQEDIPLIDVRAPVEFTEGSFPSSRNLPILNDEERHRVGLCYRIEGQDAAIRLGHELVSGEVRKARIESWIAFLHRHPNAGLYCLRGGLRSQIASSWIREAGVRIERMEGGYKRLRNHLISRFDEIVRTRAIVVLGGKTGSGKTRFLHQTRIACLDLELHANHRGSSFGALGPQPSQATFENALMAAALKLRPGGPILIEDESVMVGARVVPANLYRKMKESPLFLLEAPLEERVRTISLDYVLPRLGVAPDSTREALAFFLQGLARIQKKLGGLVASRIGAGMREAFEGRNVMNPHAHEEWIRELLVRYYDPLYEKSIERERHRIVARGTAEELLRQVEAS